MIISLLLAIQLSLFDCLLDDCSGDSLLSWFFFHHLEPFLTTGYSQILLSCLILLCKGKDFANMIFQDHLQELGILYVLYWLQYRTLQHLLPKNKKSLVNSCGICNWNDFVSTLNRDSAAVRIISHRHFINLFKNCNYSVYVYRFSFCVFADMTAPASNICLKRVHGEW